VRSTSPRHSVYDGEEYLAESLDALLGQTYTDYELIISDNASTDGTADICRRYEKRTRGSARQPADARGQTGALSRGYPLTGRLWF
jgi:glycosyltransferase involved in cell wall biosynthesis